MSDTLTVAEIQALRRAGYEVGWIQVHRVDRRHPFEGEICDGCQRRFQVRQWVYPIADLGLRCGSCFWLAAWGEDYWRGHPVWWSPERDALERTDPLAAALDREKHCREWLARCPWYKFTPGRTDRGLANSAAGPE